jgi:HK97 family phage major capsid protein
MGDEVKIGQQIESLETKLKEFSDKATAEIKNAGSVTVETKNALEKFGIEQRTIADRLMQLEQRASVPAMPAAGVKSMGDQFVENESYKAYISGAQPKARIEIKGRPWEVKNTVTTSTTDARLTPIDSRPGVVPGAFQRLLIEQLLPSTTTVSGLVEYFKEKTFTNAAAEVAEAATKPEATWTGDMTQVPITTVAHWIRVTRQLAMDAPALVAYINQRLIYGVNLRVDSQLINGNGTAPNLSGLLKAGNFTPHGYSAAALGGGATALDLIQRVIIDLATAGYMPNAVLMNPADYGGIARLKDSTGQYLMGNPAFGFSSPIWGLTPVVSPNMPADTFLVGAFDLATMVYNREGVTVEMSEHDRDNFITNLITIRAERRLALAVEIPAAIRGGDLTPA